jgi:hypothetical protein
MTSTKPITSTAPITTIRWSLTHNTAMRADIDCGILRHNATTPVETHSFYDDEATSTLFLRHNTTTPVDAMG